MIRKGIYDIDEILKKTLFIPKTGKYVYTSGQKHQIESGKYKKVLIDSELINMASDRYKLFFDNRKCVSCGLEGKYMAMERGDKDISYHFNMYGIDETGNEVLFTKDHTVPKSIGGKNNLSNYQTMCTRCNAKKNKISQKKSLHRKKD